TGSVIAVPEAVMNCELGTAVVPKLTCVAPSRSPPVMVTWVPSLLELTPVTVGPAVNWSAFEVSDVPSAVVTVTSYVPNARGGDGTVTVVPRASPTMPVVTWVVPKFTAVVPSRLRPRMVTVVPPAVGPLFGSMNCTAGPTVNSAVGDGSEWPAGVTTIT